MTMPFTDAIGYLASGLVLTTFSMKEIISLRIVALCSNLAFLVYGMSMGLVPIWLLHGLLLPMNGWRLAQALLQSEVKVDVVTRADQHIRRPPSRAS
jgi:CRP/FNR family transcriptional regulator, cyclic AMP receptor protein